jgi:uracil-DNA glycosylase
MNSKWTQILTEVGAFKCLDKVKDQDISPKKEDVFKAFEYTPYDNVKVVLIGQDPYPSKLNAMGLSFSIPKGVKLTDSLKNIYKCLDQKSTNGDLTCWTKRGILLLNAYLTTLEGKSKAHKEEWKKFLPSLLPKLPKNAVIILLGNDAQSYEKYCDGRKVLKWGHPSTLNRYNSTDNPQNFKYCTCFKEANNLTGIDFSVEDNEQFPDEQFINELSVEEQPIVKQSILEQSKYILFTDGGATGNGKSKAKGSYAWCLMDADKELAEGSGLIEKKVIGEEVILPSNNRGEMTAILLGLQKAIDMGLKQVVVISDSEYSIKSCTVWCDKWIKENKLEGKKNLDLVFDIRDKLTKIDATFKHINSHTTQPKIGSHEYFEWYYNDKVDKMCAELLKK